MQPAGARQPDSRRRCMGVCRKGSLQQQEVDLAAGAAASPWEPLIGSPARKASGAAPHTLRRSVATSYEMLTTLNHLPPTKLSFYQERSRPHQCTPVFLMCLNTNGKPPSAAVTAGATSTVALQIKRKWALRQSYHRMSLENTPNMSTNPLDQPVFTRNKCSAAGHSGDRTAMYGHSACGARGGAGVRLSCVCGTERLGPHARGGHACGMVCCSCGADMLSMALQVCDVWHHVHVCEPLRVAVAASGESLAAAASGAAATHGDDPAGDDGSAPPAADVAQGSGVTADPADRSMGGVSEPQDVDMRDAADTTCGQAEGVDANGSAAAAAGSRVGDAAVPEGQRGEAAGVAAVDGRNGGEARGGGGAGGLLVEGRGGSGWFPRSAWVSTQERLKAAVHALLPKEFAQPSEGPGVPLEPSVWREPGMPL